MSLPDLHVHRGYLRTNIPIGGGRAVFLELPSVLTEEEWERLMTWLNLIRKGLADTSDDSTRTDDS